MENHRNVEVAWTQEELNQKIESLRSQGYNESDIHVVTKDPDRFQVHATETKVDTHETGTFWDRFKSFFTGEDATTESLSKLNLEQHDQERYSADLTNGGAILYVEDHLRSDEYNTFGETGNSYESYSGETAAGTVGTEFVNKRFTDNEPILGEHTPEENRQLFKNEAQAYSEESVVENDAFNIEPRMTEEQKTEHASFEQATPRAESTESTFETTEPRFESTESTFETNQPKGYEESQAYGAESPGADPNLGPAAFGNLEPASEDEGREPSAIEDNLANHEHEERVEELENRRSENNMQDRSKY
ncbi:general stress protein [Chryseomicrobium sp. FSL W7-1435]|uniref:general stress protein n=1 Tax=Chryseomicrobium sp. FSL W7-1435 TaxID=2921704 RepID=UPI00315B23DD